ncbi:NADPH-dependent 1-acyldihydroxyacetone phosphate reductase [Choanephora cucurbitarum]|uniref:NADPH-dependent 1-acyldihydroxyacetone phosphate reductase n=1 Tax=Choanephora cucurbitarum TaxID=101091 RepID=A0A1C7NDW5_9FUNG|nr:NADPH-dependent 1-acyldihydroxyacetone phosphate reductase [Choanephora cucurbitarum]
MVEKIVLVTGCSQGGIGYSLAKQFAQQGNHVIATARRLEALDGLEAFGCDKEVLDITDKNSIDSLVKKAIDKYEHIDILVNNAGAPAYGALLDIDMAVVEQCVNTNIYGTLAMCKVVGRHMAERRQGKIVNIGSVVGYRSTPWASIYAMSKAAVHSLSDALRMELSPFGVQVVVVAPGAITSNIGNNGSKTTHVPEDSIYKSVAKFIHGRANSSQGPSSTPTDVFASHIVKKTLQKNTPSYVTYGHLSFLFVIFYYLPSFVADWILSNKFGLALLKRAKQD